MTLQPQRTDLAWTRTALATCALALFAMRLAFEEGGEAIAASIVGLMAAGCFTALARWRSQQLRSDGVPAALRATIVATIAGALVLLDLAGLALVVS